MEKMHVIV